MKRFLCCCLLLCSGTLWAHPEGARGWGQEDGGPRWERPERSHAAMTPEERQARREARRQWLDSRQAEQGLPPATLVPGGEERRRLSPEERLRLRRDVHEAGREFYPREERPPFRE